MVMKDVIRVALVGCGGVARRYRRVYGRLPGVKVVTAIDVSETEAAETAAEVGAERVSQSFEDALAGNIDAVVISTPNDLHCEQAVAALKAGKHVLLQKPMARNVKECDEILAARRSSGATLGIYMNLLDHPLFWDLREMVASGYLGVIALLSARLAQPEEVVAPAVFLASPESAHLTGQVLTVDDGASAVGCYSYETYKRHAAHA